MPIRVNIPSHIETAAGTTAGPSRGLWQGYIASGVTHVAGGLLLGSVWGTSLVQVVPPPHGTNAIELTATTTAASDPARHNDPPQAVLATAFGSESHNDLTSGIAAVERLVRTDVGELPPASPDRLNAVLPHGLERSSSIQVNMPPKKQADSLVLVDERPAAVLKKSTPHELPTKVDTAANPLAPSARQQGQDAESAPRTVSSPAPLYPAAALRQAITGRVILRVKVAVDGSVIKASVLHSSGHAILDDAALAGVRKWQFQPARQFGVAVAKDIAVPITFRIDRSR